MKNFLIAITTFLSTGGNLVKFVSGKNVTGVRRWRKPRSYLISDESRKGRIRAKRVAYFFFFVFSILVTFLILAVPI